MLPEKKIVAVSQPMYFPWIGLLNQIFMADIFVHYDDVQFARGFYNRVQVKTSSGTTMITVPLQKRHQKQKINESLISYDFDWVTDHRNVLLNSYAGTRFLDDAISIFDIAHKKKFNILSDLSAYTIELLASYLSIDQNVTFYNSSNLNIGGHSSQRLLDITKKLGGEIYLTGHGALNYLDHNLFENNSVEVDYINYLFSEYNQVFGQFTPYVSSLDAIAHLGIEAKELFQSSRIGWRSAIEMYKK